MSFTKIYVHLGWATKNRRKVLNPEYDARMEHTARATLDGLHCSLRRFGSAWDHVHLVVSLKASVSVEASVREVKRDLTIMLRSSGLKMFRWQDGFWAYSASPRRLGRLYRYVEGQRERHETLSFEEELALFERIASEE